MEIIFFIDREFIRIFLFRLISFLWFNFFLVICKNVSLLCRFVFFCIYFSFIVRDRGVVFVFEIL